MNKLQELTDKLYNDGLSKGREEGERLLEEARSQADDIIAKARKEAEDIVSEARRQADDYSQKVKSDLKMAAAQSFQATKSDIENLIIGKFAGEEVKSTLSSADFVKQFLQAIAEKFSTDDASDLSVVLPASLQDELEPFVKGQLSKVLGKEIFLQEAFRRIHHRAQGRRILHQHDRRDLQRTDHRVSASGYQEAPFRIGPWTITST